MTLIRKDRLNEWARKEGVTESDSLRVAAKAGLVKAISQDPVASKRLALKGGTLLYHCYGSPRVSIADADFADADKPKAESPRSLAPLFEVDHEGVTVRTPEGSWLEEGLIYKTEQAIFEIEGVTPPIRKEAAPPRRQQLRLTVSVREDEVLLGRIERDFRAAFLEPEQAFQTNGLNLNEVAAEKVIAWGVKDLAKHFVDLAWMARDQEDLLDPDELVRVIAEKFWREKRADETKSIFASLKGPRGLLSRFDPSKDGLVGLRKRWGADVQRALSFSPSEYEHDKSVTDPAHAFELIDGFWMPILKRLSDSRR